MSPGQNSSISGSEIFQAGKPNRVSNHKKSYLNQTTIGTLTSSSYIVCVCVILSVDENKAGSKGRCVDSMFEVGRVDGESPPVVGAIAMAE